MKMISPSHVVRTLALLVVASSAVLSQSDHFRPPAIPLVACDPYFSIWSFADHPATDWPRHWTGKVQAMCGMVRIDDSTYRVLGAGPRNIPAMKLTGTAITATRTTYEFAQNGVSVTMTFMTPARPESLATIARPLTYVAWTARSTDGRTHAVSLYFDWTAEAVVNTPDQEVVWSRLRTPEADVLCMGSREQNVLGRAGDDVRIDWGHSYLAVPSQAGAATVLQTHNAARETFVRSGGTPATDDFRMPRSVNDGWPVAAAVLALGPVSATPVSRFIVLAYDDRMSVEYFRRRLPAYWTQGGKTIDRLIADAVAGYPSEVIRCAQFDDALSADLVRTGGERYAELATLAYRQALAAHKLVIDIDGTPLLFPKENFSNGCIATVDVIYPAAPIFLLFNPELLKASLTPVLQYASMPRWKFPFAPHDLGTYPRANGQVYGGGERTEEDQMPVEESGNMLLLVAALTRAEGNAEYAVTYWPVLQTWARYLKEKGLDPANQLCTDDFAGHLAHNANLSLKAILALGAYGQLCATAGKTAEAREYARLASDYAKQWVALANDGDHYRLAFDKPGTWSQKYNLVWDRILGLRLFPPEVARTEVAYYRTKENEFGLPLDNRKDYTKLDWLVWTATLAERREDFEAIVGRSLGFVNRTTDRVPLTDWYDTKTARQVGFQARSVVGGVFIPMIADPAMWKKWVSGSVR